MENDLISRKKLIDDLEAWRKILDRRVSRFDDMVLHTLPVVFDLVNEQKAVKADKAKWISVKEKLPEDQRNVLTVNGHGSIRVMGLWTKKGNEWRWVHNYVFKRYNDITHWMPLPEPPKMDGGAENDR